MVCDRVAILDRGRVLAQGGISELTQRAAEVRLTVAGPEAAVRRALNGAQAAEPRPLGSDQFEIVLTSADQSTVDALVDRLRAGGLSLISMSPSRQTLEQAFLAILSRARANA